MAPLDMTVPVTLHVGAGASLDLGRVTVAQEPKLTRVGDVIALGVVVDPALLGDQLANLLEHAARQLRKGATDAAPRTG